MNKQEEPQYTSARIKIPTSIRIFDYQNELQQKTGERKSIDDTINERFDKADLYDQLIK